MNRLHAYNVCLLAAEHIIWNITLLKRTLNQSQFIRQRERERVLATVDVDIVNFIFDIFVYQFIALFYRFNGEYFI